jgi:hypothetical protein
MCKRLREDAHKLKEKRATLEGMIESHDELITEIAKEIGLDSMGEDVEDEDEDGNDEGDPTAPPIAVAPPPAPAPPATIAPEESIEEEDPVEVVPKQEDPIVHEVILEVAEPELSQPRLYHMLIRDYEESPSRMMDDLDDPIEASSDMDEWFPKDGSNDRD